MTQTIAKEKRIRQLHKLLLQTLTGGWSRPQKWVIIIPKMLENEKWLKPLPSGNLT